MSSIAIDQSPTVYQKLFTDIEALQHKQGQASYEVQVANLDVQALSNQVGLYNRTVNYLPSFIGSFVSTDLEGLNRYNLSLANLNSKNLYLQSVGSQVDQLITQVYTNVIQEKKGEMFFNKALNSYQNIIQLQAEINQTINLLNRAENAEWWDGMSDDRHCFGAYNKMDSRWSNMDASNQLERLNQSINNFNIVSVGDCAALPTLWGAGSSLMQAELNESSLLNYFMGSFGDYLSSHATLNTIRSIKGHVHQISGSVGAQAAFLRQKIVSEIKAKKYEVIPELIVSPSLEDQIIQSFISQPQIVNYGY